MMILEKSLKFQRITDIAKWIAIAEICYKICNGTYLKFSKMMKSNK